VRHVTEQTSPAQIDRLLAYADLAGTVRCVTESPAAELSAEQLRGILREALERLDVTLGRTPAGGAS
jgi:hypothetical protein